MMPTTVTIAAMLRSIWPVSSTNVMPVPSRARVEICTRMLLRLMGRRKLSDATLKKSISASSVHSGARVRSVRTQAADFFSS